MHLDDTSLIVTNHARERAQARGIPMRIVEAIYANADRSPFVGDGRRSLMVSRRRLARLADNIPAADRERMEGVVLVVDASSGVVITVLHAHSPWPPVPAPPGGASLPQSEKGALAPVAGLMPCRKASLIRAQDRFSYAHTRPLDWSPRRRRSNLDWSPAPTSYRALSVYPLRGTAPCSVFNYLVLDDALATGRLRVTEVSDDDLSRSRSIERVRERLRELLHQFQIIARTTSMLMASVEAASRTELSLETPLLIESDALQTAFLMSPGDHETWADVECVPVSEVLPAIGRTPRAALGCVPLAAYQPALECVPVSQGAYPGSGVSRAISVAFTQAHLRL